MISKRLWRFSRLSRQISVRISFMAALAVLAAFAAWALEDFIPDPLSERFKWTAVGPVLTILASSMLAVVTFSLSVMVSAFRAASAQVTPRAHRLLLEDTTSQTVLATFLGAFIFALVSLILSRVGIYSSGAAVIVFGVTVIVLVLVIVSILRWIHHLSHFGSMDNTLAKLEKRVAKELQRHRKMPGLGGAALSDDVKAPKGVVPVRAEVSGFVQHVDIPELADCADGLNVTVYMNCVSGDWVAQDDILAHVDHAAVPTLSRVRDAFTIEPMRDFDQDPRFGLTVLAEIASRALSPGINDSGTALDVIGRLERLLIDNAPDRIANDAPAFENVFIRGPSEAALIEAAFAIIARDGANRIEVAEAVQKSLLRIAQTRNPNLANAARDMAARAFAYGETALSDEGDLNRLRLLKRC